MIAIPTGTKVLVVGNEQWKRHDESARIDPQYPPPDKFSYLVQKFSDREQD